MSLILSFGNPNREFLRYLKEETYLDSLLTELKNYNPPTYDSTQAEQEINELVQMCDKLHTDEPVEGRYKYYDANFDKYIASVLANAGVSKPEVELVIKQLHDDITPLLMKLKYHYQRVRPTQLAFYYNAPLYPYWSVTASTPSYPSGHCFQAKVYCEVLGNMYPKYYQSLQQLAEDIAVSRMYLGVHYPSDIEFGKYCAELVLNHPDFKKKYKL
jgi:hypothetical protein